MGTFSVTVKPQIIEQQVKAAETRDINKLAQQYQLNKAEINGDGLDISEAPHLGFDMFMKLSNNDTNISKADLLKFAGTETADDIVRNYAYAVAESLPRTVDDTMGKKTSTGAVPALIFEVKKRGEEIIVGAKRSVSGGDTPAAATRPAADGVFSVINGRDLDGDGQISLGGELAQSSTFVRTAGDAVSLAGPDMKVSATEALTAILAQAGKVPMSHIQIQYNN